ncbi:MAG TPA: patatin-like phospholipase family protein [Pyrinomonadaceae bacterium]|nr:patatin-like phospholipase family protein [Pyrinomonadaceae bacterium]
MGKLFQIMTFDGGGIRGALVATLLRRLEGRFPELLHNVDLFAGTSTGSALALSLAYGKSTADLQSLYSTEQMKFVFGKSRWNFLRPRHSNENLKKLLEGNFPDIQETQGSGSRKLLLSDLKKKVLVTSFKLDDQKLKSWSPVFFHNYPNEETCMEPSSNEPVVDVALRSAAAPTIFPSHQGHIDGGMMANNPSTAAIAVALRHNPGLDIKNIRLLSFGTGYTPTLVKTETKNWGVLQWLLNPFNQPKEPLLTILFDGVVQADDFMSREILGEERYQRVNLELTNQTACDDWRQVETLVKLAISKDEATEKLMDESVKWLSSNWFDEAPQISTVTGRR